MKSQRTRTCLLASVVLLQPTLLSGQDLTDRVEHHYADSDGVKIHYVTLGEGPLVIMIHGFPDYWYTWRHQMEALSANHRIAAMDMRGYNRSDKPKGVESYGMRLLVDDVAAVLEDAGEERAIIVGHDWGGMVAWQFAMGYPDKTDKLIILNLPHPRGLARELANNPEQQRNSQYARNFQQPNAHAGFTAEGLAGWVTDAAAREHYVEDGPVDHWATLAETLHNNGDDCDGLELLVQQLLFDLGFPGDQVYRAVVRRPSDDQHHMVTLWFESPDDPWVIDPTGAMVLGLRRMSEVPGWVPLKLFSSTEEFTVRQAFRTP